jgi:hypothetical protein
MPIDYSCTPLGWFFVDVDAWKRVASSASVRAIFLNGVRVEKPVHKIGPRYDWIEYASDSPTWLGVPPRKRDRVYGRVEVVNDDGTVEREGSET